MKKIIFLLAPILAGLVVTLFIFGCGERQPDKKDGVDISSIAKEGGGIMTTFTVTSSAFQNGQKIPIQYTGEDQDISPQISWNKITGAQSYVLICDDPDASRTEPWVHWVIFNIPASLSGLPENAERSGVPTPACAGGINSASGWEKTGKPSRLGGTAGAIQGKNDSGKIGYAGPMPPKGHGLHHYHFKVYALDTMLDLKEGSTKSDVEKAMKGHIVAQGELTGTYERK